jgi:RNA polymerase sigma-70 factor, ECF subfamily
MHELVIAQAFGQAERLENDRAAREREFEARVAECSNLAFRVACGVLHNAADAEEVTQEAFLRAYRKLDDLREPKNFKAWLVRITFRIAIDRLRAAKRRNIRETAWMESGPSGLAPDAATGHELRGHLQRALDDLPERQRLALILTAIEGHTLADVAGMLGLPEGTVKSRVHFGKKQLAEKLRWIAGRTKTT